MKCFPQEIKISCSIGRQKTRIDAHRVCAAKLSVKAVEELLKTDVFGSEKKTSSDKKYCQLIWTFLLIRLIFRIRRSTKQFNKHELHAEDTQHQLLIGFDAIKIMK